jgi:hypothetical protein
MIGRLGGVLSASSVDWCIDRRGGEQVGEVEEGKGE